MKTEIEVIDGKVVLIREGVQEVFEYRRHLTVDDVMTIFYHSRQTTIETVPLGSENDRVKEAQASHQNNLVKASTNVVHPHLVATSTKHASSLKGKLKRERYLRAGDYLGVSVKQFTHMLNGALTKAYIRPNYVLIKRLGYTKGYINTDIVTKLLARKEYIQGFEEDGCITTSAFGLYYDSPSDAKKTLGKGLWKTLCKNSRSRNDLIVKSALHYIDIIEAKQLFVGLSSIPSTVLSITRIADGLRVRVGFINDVIAFKGIALKRLKEQDFIHQINIFHDCKRMCEQLSKPFNPNWSLKKIHKVHTRVAKEIMRERFPTTKFGICGILPLSFTKNNLTATLVRSPSELFELGLQERHCVAGLSFYCINFAYAVYKMVDREGLISTLGIPLNKSHESTFLTFQHYHVENKEVTCPERISFGEFIKSKVEDIPMPIPPSA